MRNLSGPSLNYKLHYSILAQEKGKRTRYFKQKGIKCSPLLTIIDILKFLFNLNIFNICIIIISISIFLNQLTIELYNILKRSEWMACK